MGRSAAALLVAGLLLLLGPASLSGGGGGAAPERHQYCVVGAGPAGLQLGFFLQQAQRGRGQHNGYGDEAGMVHFWQHDKYHRQRERGRG